MFFLKRDKKTKKMRAINTFLKQVFEMADLMLSKSE